MFADVGYEIVSALFMVLEPVTVNVPSALVLPAIFVFTESLTIRPVDVAAAFLMFTAFAADAI